MASTPKGNLLKNPGFELGLAFWQVPPSTTCPEPGNVAAMSLYSHSGFASLAMGLNDPNLISSVYQDVHVSPGSRYELAFSLSGLSSYPTSFAAEIRWLDEDGDDLGVALAIVVPEVGAVAEGDWTLHKGITEEAPVGARQARVSFHKGNLGSPVLLDDVSMIKAD